MPKTSAGILLYRMGENGAPDVLLVHPGGPFWRNKDANAWSIPKGAYEPGEAPADAAQREFEEELGLAVPDAPRADLGTVRQASGKYVRAWALRADEFRPETFVSNLFQMEWPPKSGRHVEFPEVDRAEWRSLSEARLRLVAAQVELLDRLLSLLESEAKP